MLSFAQMDNTKMLPRNELFLISHPFHCSFYPNNNLHDISHTISYSIVYMDHIIWSILEQFLHINRWINENIVAFVDDEKSIHCETIIFVQIRSNWNLGRVIISTSFFENWFHHFSPSYNQIINMIKNIHHRLYFMVEGL